MSQLISGKIMQDPRYIDLVRRRARLAWTLSIIVCLMFYGFILLIAFAPGFLTAPIASGSVIPVGLPMGVGVILGSCLLTGIYVYEANSVFDPIFEQIVREASK
jgi:uncharacterized membrane protein (DUF485 family)